jgi:hypothetical protein
VSENYRSSRHNDGSTEPICLSPLQSPLSPLILPNRRALYPFPIIEVSETA